MTVFVDTSAFYAVLSRTDENHERAVSDWTRLIDDDSIRLCTSNYVVVEACALIRNRLGDEALRRFLDSLLPLVMIFWVDQATHALATTEMLAHGINGPSLVDCASFAAVRNNGVRNALAYDKHFASEGFALD